MIVCIYLKLLCILQSGLTLTLSVNGRGKLAHTTFTIHTTPSSAITPAVTLLNFNMVQHSPRGKATLVQLQTKVEADFRVYRRKLSKLNGSLVKILSALYEDGCIEAGVMIGEPGRLPAASRCAKCIGCRIMTSEGACQVCPACRGHQGCVEYSRLCWTCEPTSHHVPARIHHVQRF